MALTRVTDFSGRGVLSEIDPEFNNYRDYINNRLLANPLTSDLDFGNQFTIQNLRTFWQIRNGSEFGGFNGSSIQAAINDLPSTGGLVFLPDGTYTISQTINLRTGVVLWGYGKESTILQRTTGTFTATDNAFIYANSVNGCGLLNLQLDGNAQTETALGSLFRTGGTSSRIWIRDCYLKRNGATALGNDGIRLESTGRGFWITDCLIEDMRRNGISVIEAQDFFITDNEVVNTSGSLVNNSNHAIDVEPNSGKKTRMGTIQDNIIRGWRVGGIQLVGAAAAPTTVSRDIARVNVIGNTIEDCGARGILVWSFRDVVVQGNTLDQTGLQGGVTGCVHVEDSENVVIDGNTLLRNGIGAQNEDGIDVLCNSATQRSANIVISNNVLEQSSRTGIRISSLAAGGINGVSISDNSVISSGRTDTDRAEGILVNRGAGTVREISIKGNTVILEDAAANADHDAINFVGASSKVIVTGNNLSRGFQGSGEAIRGRSNVTQLEEGHNISETG